VHSGAVIAGCLGSGDRLEFTVIGDTVNVASRLEAETKQRGVAIIVSTETVTRAAPGALAQMLARGSSLVPLGSAMLRGRRVGLELQALAS
jgi:class 3 adenylate cyclase